MADKNPRPLLRIPRIDTDNADQFVLLRADTYSGSAHPLDVYLLATEGENAYGLKIKHNRIHKYLHRAFTGTHEEFETMLSALLLHTPVDDNDKVLLDGVGFSATIDDATITLALRKSVGVIKQRLAVFEIPQTEDEISLYEWAGEVCQVRDEAEAKLLSLEAKAATYEQQAEKLIEQLKNLTDLKREHEDAMLMKFEQLLNSKKQRVRELLKQLESGALAQQGESSKVGQKGKNPRKRPAEVEENEENSDDERDIMTSEDEARKSVSKTRKPPASKGKGKAATAAADRKRSTPSARVRSTTKPSSKKSSIAAVASIAGRGRGSKQSDKEQETKSRAEKTLSPVIRSPSPTAGAAHGDASGGEENDVTNGETDDDDEL